MLKCFNLTLTPQQLIRSRVFHLFAKRLLVINSLPSLFKYIATDKSTHGQMKYKVKVPSSHASPRHGYRYGVVLNTDSSMTAYGGEV
jgi:hypothetical protein